MTYMQCEVLKDRKREQAKIFHPLSEINIIYEPSHRTMWLEIDGTIVDGWCWVNDSLDGR